MFSGSVPALQCPWHGWSFRLDDGGTPASTSVRVRSYPVRIAAGRVVIELNRNYNKFAACAPGAVRSD